MERNADLEDPTKIAWVRSDDAVPGQKGQRAPPACRNKVCSGYATRRGGWRRYWS